VAERFGAEGFAVALLARNPDRLAAGVAALKDQGVTALACPGDAGDPSSLREALARACAELGPIGVLHWNAYGGHALGDLIELDPRRLLSAFGVSVVGLLAAVQEALPGLVAAKDGAVLVTNGAYGETNPMIDRFAIAGKAEGVALGNAAKGKLVGLLAERLRPLGVHVGEVTIAGVVRGTGPDTEGVPTIEPATIADAFWRLYSARSELRIRIG
jgi:NADP-dependent 3-hydroxy acid dehydrogenase YdfG